MQWVARFNRGAPVEFRMSFFTLFSGLSRLLQSEIMQAMASKVLKTSLLLAQMAFRTLWQLALSLACLWVLYLGCLMPAAFVRPDHQSYPGIYADVCALGLMVWVSLRFGFYCGSRGRRIPDRTFVMFLLTVLWIWVAWGLAYAVASSLGEYQAFLRLDWWTWKDWASLLVMHIVMVLVLWRLAGMIGAYAKRINAPSS